MHKLPSNDEIDKAFATLGSEIKLKMVINKHTTEEYAEMHKTFDDIVKRHTNLTPVGVEELRKDKQTITAQSDKLWEIFQGQQQQQQEDQPDIESVYEALTGSLSQKV